jgi:cytochrome c55X
MKTSVLLLALLISAYPAAGACESAQPGSARQAQLRRVLQQNCTICHGSNLNGGAGPALTPKTLAAKDEQLLVATILDGRQGTVMPSWSWMLQESDARWLVRMLRSGKN